MKYIKKFELKKSDKNRPHVGDYVLVYEKLSNGDEFDNIYNDFIQNNIGKINYIDTSKEFPFYIEYENIPEEIDEYFNEYNEIRVTLKNLIYYSNNKEDVELQIKANKYNL